MKESGFVNDDERKAFRKLRSHVNRHGDFPTRLTYTKRLKLPYINTNEPVSFYMQSFYEKAKHESARRVYGDLTEALTVADTATVERLINSLALQFKTYNTDELQNMHSFDDLAELVIEDSIRAQFSGGMKGVTTGWPEIDQQIGGYDKGDFVTWAMRLGRGKTWLLLYQAYSAALAGKRVLFISPEVPSLQLARRVVGIVTGLNPRLIARGQISTVNRRHMRASIDAVMRRLPITFFAGHKRVTMQTVDAMIAELEPDIVFADAAYLISPSTKRAGSGGRRETISDAVEELSGFSTFYDIPIISSFQINRTGVKSEEKPPAGGAQQNSGPYAVGSRTRKDPLAHLDVHKLAESDAIGQISSLVFVGDYGDPPHMFDTRYIGLKKGREGDTGTWKINYKFSPFNFSVINDGNSAPEENDINEEDIDQEID